jgi:hypothetical protein
MSLAGHLQALIGSEPFERLLTSRARPIEAQTETGDAFVLAGLATALDCRSRRGAGPHEAEALVADVEAFLPAPRCCCPRGGPAYELISPTPRSRLGDRPRCVASASPVRSSSSPRSWRSSKASRRRPASRADPRAARWEAAPDALAERLIELGYGRVDVVEHRGEFAVRGGVLDVFPAEQRRPMRLEFWGDEIESIRRFVPSTQLSRGPSTSPRSVPPGS